jgi:hypothetical protein
MKFAFSLTVIPLRAARALDLAPLRPRLLGDQAPVLEVAEEPPHVVLVVLRDQGEGHRQVGQRVGRQQQGEPAQVQLVDAQRAAETVQDLAAVRGHVELAGAVAEHVVDEPGGEVQEELAADRLQRAFDVHTIAEDPLEDQVADLVVVLGLGCHALGRVAEGLAAVAGGGILAVGDLQDGDLLVGHGTDGARQGPLASAAPAALRARRLLGCAANG